MKLLFLLNLVAVVRCQCDTYSTCLNSFVNNFFKNVNVFEPSEIQDDTPDFIDFGRENINKILSGVSGFLQDEVRGTLDLDTEYHSFSKDNGTRIFVKTFVINDNSYFDLQDHIFEDTPIDPSDPNAVTNSQTIKNVGATEIIKTHDDLLNNDTTPSTLRHIESSTVKQTTRSEKTIEENEIPDEDYSEDNSTDYTIIDYIELYKDTTNEYVEYTTESQIKDIADNIKIKSHANNNRNITSYHTDSCPGTSDDVTTVFSWIAAIFIKNGTDQFQYYCDGAILSTNIIVTAARCVNFTQAEDVIVILGKTSLQQVQSTERMIKINEVIVHENFTDTSNDLALLKTEDAIEITNTVSIACLNDSDNYTEALTTGWAISGELTAIDFDKVKSEECKTPGNICGVYENDITTCPSFGGVFATKTSGWHLSGIRSAMTRNLRICVHAPVYYTPLNQYVKWFGEYV